MERNDHGSMETNREGEASVRSRDDGPGREAHPAPGMIRPKPIEELLRSEMREDGKKRLEPKRDEKRERIDVQPAREEPPEDPNDRIAPRIEEWIEQLRKKAGYEESFDVQVRQMTFGGRKAGLLFLSTLIQSVEVTELLKRLSYADSEAVRHDEYALNAFLAYDLPIAQVTRTSSFENMLENVLMGNSALYVDGETEVLLLDMKQFPTRSPEEPELEKVVRGSRDGFTETLLFNVALVRRRLRDKRVRFEILRVGTRTQTDIALGYIEDIANPELIESVRDKVQAVNIDGIPLADKQLEEMTVKTNWNPFPLVRYSERPDVVSAHLLNGSVTLMVDTSPSVMLLPTTYFDLVQHAEEKRQNPLIGTYLRWVRFFGILTSVFLLPMWYLFAQNTGLRPNWLWFLGANDTGDLPLVVQFLLVEVGVDLMRLAAVHTPTPLVTAMSLVSAILVGDIAVKTGLFINEVILYMAVAAIGTFATPSYELGLANRIVRLALLLSAFALGVPGLVVCSTIALISLVMIRSFNAPYMWPFIPFNGKALLSVLLRQPLPNSKIRPSIYRSRENKKQPS
ncbi:spore germination protein [Cohnella zeiphila]|uniref:Spore germination protein n=1 Tax=Cohnella zeiphila TaxID=2761120 RepID=A0A7X0SIE8_9BACL|nr:spore germination protein [Cohnella zeiphila]MBB6730451.1 spore germination protein [Cohnella zeiphila]